jgi:hypothetical protein
MHSVAVTSHRKINGRANMLPRASYIAPFTHTAGFARRRFSARPDVLHAYFIRNMRGGDGVPSCVWKISARCASAAELLENDGFTLENHGQCAAALQFDPDNSVWGNAARATTANNSARHRSSRSTASRWGDAPSTIARDVTGESVNRLRLAKSGDSPPLTGAGAARARLADLGYSAFSGVATCWGRQCQMTVITTRKRLARSPTTWTRTTAASTNGWLKKVPSKFCGGSSNYVRTIAPRGTRTLIRRKREKLERRRDASAWTD